MLKSLSAFKLVWGRILALDKGDWEKFRCLFPDNNDYEIWQFSRLHKVTLGIIAQDLEHALLEPNIDVDHTDSEGRTALMWAVKRNDIRAVALLIDAKASVIKAGQQGNTSLMYVQDLPCLKLLLEAGADAKAVNRYRENVLHHMGHQKVHSNASEATRLLISAGADIEARDQAGSTPLARCTMVSWIDAFLDHGANINAVDNDGDTCLNNALFYQADHSVALLLRRGAACNILNNNGDSLLYVAAKHGSTCILDILNGADIRDIDTETPNKQAKTAYQEAEERGSKPEDFLEKFAELLAGIRARTQGSHSGPSGSADEVK